MICFSSSIVDGFDVETFFLISIHKFSMGLSSGEFPGHLTDLALWHGAEYYWDVVHP